MVCGFTTGSELVDCQDGRHCKAVLEFEDYCVVFNCSEGVCQVPNCPFFFQRQTDCEQVYCTGHKEKKSNSTAVRDWLIAIFFFLGLTGASTLVIIRRRRRESPVPLQRSEEEARLLDNVTYNPSTGLVQISLDLSHMNVHSEPVNEEVLTDEEQEELTQHQDASPEDEFC